MARRTVALALCVAMVASLITFILPMRASAAPGNPVSLRNLYVREADENTMDSYVLASLGGLVYLQEGVDGVSTATVRNNYGSRFAGEIWADKSVFAQYQDVIAQIRPFESGNTYTNSPVVLSGVTTGTLTSGKLVKTVYTDNVDYDGKLPQVLYERKENPDGTYEYTTVSSGSTDNLYTTGVNRAMQTLHHWLGVDDDAWVAKANACFPAGTADADKFTNTADLVELLTSGALSSYQADALNAAINAAIADRVANTYKYNGDGDFHFDGTNGVLQLGRDTDGVTSNVELPEESDFLHVFSVLGSSKETTGAPPIDVVFVLDVTGSMNSVYDGGSKICQSVDALNRAITRIMDLNDQNRVAVVLFAVGAAVLMPLDHYDPIPDNYIAANNVGEITTDGDYDVYVQIVGANGNTHGTFQGADLNRATVSTSGRVYGSPANDDAGNGNFGYKNESIGDDWPDLGGLTNLDAGYWTGLGLLAGADDTRVKIDGQDVDRVPAFILLGDGDPMYMMQMRNSTGATPAVNATTDPNNGSNANASTRWYMNTQGRVNNNGNWWDPYDPTVYFQDVGAWNSYHNPSVMVGTVLRAALMKTAAEQNYSGQDLQFYTIGIELIDDHNLNNQNKSWFTTRALFDPANFLDTAANIGNYITENRTNGDAVFNGVPTNTNGSVNTNYAECVEDAYLL